jgi:hypothetical protein
MISGSRPFETASILIEKDGPGKDKFLVLNIIYLIGNIV